MSLPDDHRVDRVVRPRIRVELPVSEGTQNGTFSKTAFGGGRLWEKTSPEWREQAAVHRVSRGVWRASSLVECINSGARIQQSRHRKMTQGLLDLKRLSWTLWQFRAGHRKVRYRTTFSA